MTCERLALPRLRLRAGVAAPTASDALDCLEQGAPTNHERGTGGGKGRQGEGSDASLHVVRARLKASQ